MAERKAPHIRQSLLDRLLVDDPRSRVDPPQSTSQLVRSIKLSVQRDLEDLLNSKWRMMTWSSRLSELDNSLVNYGIPDFAKLDDPLNFDRLCEFVREAIERFEPRLTRVKVTPLSKRGSYDRTVCFRIDAILNIEPITDEISFHSVLEPSTANFQVSRSKEGA